MGKGRIAEIFKPAIIDFIARASEIPNLTGAILFGSALTGNISPKSDIDILLLFNCAHNPEVGEEMKTAVRIAGEICSKHGLPHSFSFVVVNSQTIKEVDADFLWNISRESIVIWGLPENILSRKPHSSLEPLLLVTYSVNGLLEKNRRGVFRALYGQTYKGRRQWLIDKENERLGPGTFLVSAHKLDAIKKVFDNFGVKKYSIKKLWGH